VRAARPPDLAGDVHQPDRSLAGRRRPWVIRAGDAYFFTATLAPDSGLSVWKARTLTGLDSGTKVRVWNAPPDGPLSRQIWAPELHRLRGRWYIY
jgi:GH43 family beta-xylosidase